MASLVDQILAQSQAGSAQGEGFGQYYMQGKAQGLQQQRINLEKQQLAAELAQMPLKQTLMQQTVKLRGLEVENLLRDRQNYLASTDAFTNLTSQVSPLLEAGKLEDAQRLTASAGLKNNFLLTDPRYKAFSAQIESMGKEADLARYRLMQIDTAQARVDATVEAAKIRAEAQSGIADVKNQLLTDREARLKDREERITETAHTRIISQDRILQDWQKQLDRLQTQLEQRVQGGPSVLQQVGSKLPYNFGVSTKAFETETARLQKMVNDLAGKIEQRKQQLLGSAAAPAPATTAPTPAATPSDPLGLFTK